MVQFTDIWLIILISVFTGHQHSCTSSNLTTVYSWKWLEFEYPRVNGTNPSTLFPIDVDIYADGTERQKVFITIPRVEANVPVTLGYVSSKLSAHGNPIIAPYPDLKWNTIESDCSHLTSVFRTQVDECDRLWVLDTGLVVNDQLCPPQLFVFDLKTDQFISRYSFSYDLLSKRFHLITPVVDVRDPMGKCEDTFVYIADCEGFQMIVYDDKNKKAWNIQNNNFYPWPPHGYFTINGESFDLMDGIFGMALSPLKSGEDRILYFHALASVVEDYVRTSVIRNATIFEGNPGAMRDEFKYYPQYRPSQATVEAMDKNGILFYGMGSETAVGCWNSQKYPAFGPNNVNDLVYNAETLQFPTGLKISNNVDGRQKLWTITMRLQKGRNGTRKPSETNYRILSGFVDELIEGTQCDPNYVEN